MQNILVFLVKAHLKLVLGDSSEISYCKVNFCNIYIKLHRISIKVKMTLEQEIIKLVKLSAIKSIRNINLSSSWIKIRIQRIDGKYVCNTTEYIGQLLDTAVSGVVHTEGESLQDKLEDVWTCKTTLASAYILCCLSAMWS